jgi:hypothetical protein
MRSVLDRVAIADVLRLAGVVVEQRGQRTWFSCPVHRPDEHPSAVIVGERGFRCHACGAKGGVLDLTVALGHGRDRAAAARWLENLL